VRVGGLCVLAVSQSNMSLLGLVAICIGEICTICLREKVLAVLELEAFARHVCL